MKAKSLSEVYDLFDPQEALSGEKLREYYVSRTSPIDRCVNALKNSKKPLKYLFVGSRGNGKSTELNRLAELVENNLIIVSFSVKDKLDLYDIEYSDILLVIATEIYNKVSKEVDLSSELKEYLSLWSEKVVERISQDSAIIGAGLSFPAFLVNITTKLKTEASTRSITREVIQPRLSDLIDAINRIIFEAEEKLDKSILVIIDDLDKLSLKKAEDLLYMHGSALVQPKCKIIYTIPQPLIFSNKIRPIVLQYFDDRIPLPNIKIHNRKGEIEQTGFELMRRIALTRMEASLISEEALDLAVEYSAGVITEFIRIIRSSGNIADTNKKERIEKEDIEQSIAEVKNDYIRNLDQEDFKILKEINETKCRTEGNRFQDLLFSLAVLEYSNSEVWYDIHPAIKGVIERIKAIKE